MSVVKGNTMQMQYWKNVDSNEVFGYDVSDTSQLDAMQARMAEGDWENVTDAWPVHTTASAERNKLLAAQLLSGTDWVNQPDVVDPNVTPHLLNQSDFIAYRSALRMIAVNPQPGDLVWPIAPQARWAS